MLYHNEFYLFITFFIELVGLVLYNPVLYKMSRLFKFIIKILRIGMYNLMLISMQQTYLFNFFWKRIYMICILTRFFCFPDYPQKDGCGLSNIGWFSKFSSFPKNGLKETELIFLSGISTFILIFPQQSTASHYPPPPHITCCN